MKPSYLNQEDAKTTQRQTSMESFKPDEFSAQGLTKKQRKNLQEIANKYYQQASELMFDNLTLNQKVQQLTEEKNILLAKLACYQREKGEQVTDQSNSLLLKLNKQENDLYMPKRNRRLSTQVKKKFQCPLEKCNKLYGTYAALYLHFKNKHPDRSMKLIAHSSNTIKVSGQEQEDQFLKEMRLMKEEEELRKSNSDLKPCRR